MKIACVIPARGGSKGIPKKNIVDFNGQPLISYSINQAIDSKYIEKVYVTSDSQEILDISRESGADIILRPYELSSDTSSSEEALIHCLENIDNRFEIIVFLQATSPLRTTLDIDKCIERFFNDNLDSLFSACVLDDFLIWDYVDGNLKSLNYDYENRKRRQDHNPQFVENGSIYIFKKNNLLKYKNRLTGRIGFSIMENWKMFEIDDFESLELCEIIYKNKLKK